MTANLLAVYAYLPTNSYGTQSRAQRGRPIVTCNILPSLIDYHGGLDKAIFTGKPPNCQYSSWSDR